MSTDRSDRSVAEFREPFRSRPGATGGCPRSSYFGRVVARLGPDRFGFPVQTVLRSGRYLTQDHGICRRTSPFDGRGTPTGPRLQPALELFASVLSRPEPTLVIEGFGRRDAPIDQLSIVLGRSVTTVK